MENKPYDPYDTSWIGSLFLICFIAWALCGLAVWAVNGFPSPF